jgi:formylglycine-generating enzyme required for sulfatase activity
MKRCPTCNRTFEDTMSFCLVDGSILSAPFDPNATQQPAASPNIDPAATRILDRPPDTVDSAGPPQDDIEITSPPLTIASPAPMPSPQEKTSSAAAQKYPSTEEQASHSALKTIKAAPPDLGLGSYQRMGPTAKTTPSSDSTQSHATGGKRLRVIGAVVVAAILIGGIVWLIQRARTRTASPATTQSQQAKQTANEPPPTGQPFTQNIGGVEIQMVFVPGGTFLMGSPTSETVRDADEGPQSDVTVQSLYMSKYEVTQAEYKAVMGSNPSSFKGDDLPVDSVSWNDAVEFCRKLSAKSGRDYRLPTEAEWEYASRAGTTGPWAGDVDTLAWYGANSGSRTHPVGQKQPNGFKLYDMNGNVWEWCQSKYKPYPYRAGDGREDLHGNDVRVMRGGSWESPAISCRSAYRRRVIPDTRSIGFRIILVAR